MSSRAAHGTSQVCQSLLSSLRPLTVTSYRRIAKRPRDRHSSSNPHPASATANRNSRSHSPSHQKPQKRRNTMNSRDAAYDEMMALIVENSVAEAAGPTSAQSPPSPINGSVNGQADGDEQLPSPATSKKKRKRTSEDALVCLSPISYFCNSPNTDRSASIKRTRSASTTSDRPIMSKPPHEDTPAPTPKSISMPAPPVPPPKSSSSRNRRGGGRSRPSAQAQDAASVDGDEGEKPYRLYLNSYSLSPCLYTYIYRWWCSGARAEQPTVRGSF